jgi:hypothetical protein
VIRRAYFEFSAEPDADLNDRDAWAQANPGLGLRQTEEAIEAERQAMSDEMFARERLSISPDLPEGYGIIPEAAWLDCQDSRHRPDGPLAYAIDVSPDARSTAVAVSDGRHVEIVKHAAGTSWVVDACIAKKAALAAGVTLDPAGPAGELVAPLEAAGVTVRQVSTRDHAAACAGFLSGVDPSDATERTVVHIGQPELTRAVLNADKRPVGDGAWLWSRRKSNVDISPLVAVTLSRWAAVSTKTNPVFAY